MLSIFRTNQILTSVLLIFYILILRGSVFILPVASESISQGIWSNVIFEWLDGNMLWSNLLAFGLLLVHAILINMLVAHHRLGHELNLFPGLFYILVASMIPDYLVLSPFLLANTFLLIALMELFSTYKVPACADRIFNIGFWVGVASLFYFSYIIFVIWGLIALGILRAFRIKERLGLIIGAFIPFFLVGTYFFLVDRYDYFFQNQFLNNIGFLDFQVVLDTENIIKLMVLGGVLILVILSIGQYKSKQVIQVQKKIDILVWALLLAFFSLLIQSNITITHSLILSIPLGIFLALNFTEMKNQWAESIHLILLVAVLAWQFQPLLL